MSAAKNLVKNNNNSTKSSTEMKNHDQAGTSTEKVPRQPNITAKPQTGTSIHTSKSIDLQNMRQYITRSKYDLITKPPDNTPDLELPNFSSHGTIKDFLRNLNLFPSRSASNSKRVPKTVTSEAETNQSKISHQDTPSNPTDVGTLSAELGYPCTAKTSSNTQVLNFPNAIDVDDIKVINDTEATSETSQPEMTHETLHPKRTRESNHPEISHESNHPKRTHKPEQFMTIIESNHPKTIIESNHPKTTIESNHPKPTIEPEQFMTIIESNHPKRTRESNHPELSCEPNYQKRTRGPVYPKMTYESDHESNHPEMTLKSEYLEITHESDHIKVTRKPYHLKMGHVLGHAKMTPRLGHAKVTSMSDHAQMTPTLGHAKMIQDTGKSNEHLLSAENVDLPHCYKKNPVVFNVPSAENISSRDAKSNSKSVNSQFSSTTKSGCDALKIHKFDIIPATVTSQSTNNYISKPVAGIKEITPPKASGTNMPNAGLTTPITPLGKLLITPKSKVKANAFPAIQEVINASKTPGSVLYSILAQLREMENDEDSPDWIPESSAATNEPEKHDHQEVEHTLPPVIVEAVKSVPMHSNQIGNHCTDLKLPPSPVKEQLVRSCITPINQLIPDSDAPTSVEKDSDILPTNSHIVNQGPKISITTIIIADTKALPTNHKEKPILDDISAKVQLDADTNSISDQSVKEICNIMLSLADTLEPVKSEPMRTSIEDTSPNVDEPTVSADVLDSSIEMDQAEDSPNLEQTEENSTKADQSPQHISNSEEQIKLETAERLVDNEWSTDLHVHPITTNETSSVPENIAHAEDQRLKMRDLPPTDAYLEDTVDGSDRNIFSVFNLSPSPRKTLKNKSQQNLEGVSESPLGTNVFGDFFQDASVMDDSKDDSDGDVWPEDQPQGSPQEIKALFQTLISEVRTLGPNIFVNSKKVFRTAAQDDRNGTDDYTNFKSTSEPILCPICNIPFKFASHILEHVKIHFHLKPFKCHFCPKRFRRKHGGLKKHMLTHTAEKSLNCGICNKTFTQSAYLAQHMTSHTDYKPFKCELCGRAFKKKCHVQAHMSCQHSDDKPYVCSSCGKRYKLNSHLVQHIKTHTDERAYSCAQCSKSFHAAMSLKRHMKLHTGEKPFECEVCGKTFIERGNWTRHLKRVCKKEMEDRKFKCEYCDKRFLQRNHRKVHMRIHTTEIPFWCRLCGKGFKTAGNRKSHYTWHVKKHDIDTVDVLEETDALIEAQTRALKNVKSGMHLPTHPRVCNIMSYSKDEDEDEEIVFKQDSLVDAHKAV